MSGRIDREKIVQQFLKLVQIDNPSLNEREMADEVERQLEELGIPYTEDDSFLKTGGNAGNIFAVVSGTLPGQPVLFSAHLDAVSPAVGKKAVVHSNGIITSAGDTVLGADDLAGITEILEAVRWLKQSGTPHRTIELLFTCAEELYDVGSEFFDYDKIQAREAYVLDAAGETGTFLYKAPSIISFEFQSNGAAAHAGFNPELGIHAIQIAAEAIGQVQMGRMDSETTVNIGEIFGGSGTNIVPERCTVKGEIRSYQHEKALAQLERVKRTFRETASAHGATVTMSERIALQAYETRQDSICIENYKKVCERLGYPFNPQESFGGSDNNGLAAHGIEGIVLACGMQNAHSVREYSTADMLVETAETVIELVCLEG